MRERRLLSGPGIRPVMREGQQSPKPSPSDRRSRDMNQRPKLGTRKSPGVSTIGSCQPLAAPNLGGIHEGTRRPTRKQEKLGCFATLPREEAPPHPRASRITVQLGTPSRRQDHALPPPRPSTPTEASVTEVQFRCQRIKRWMPREDSNLNRRYQKPQSYH